MNGEKNQVLINARVSFTRSDGKLGYSVDELAQKCGVSAPTIRKAERGEPIRELQKERIAHALGKTRLELWPHVHEPGIAIEEPVAG